MENLLLAIYFLVVFYVLYQMALSLERKQEDAVYISVDTEFLEQQVRSQLDQQPEGRQVDTSIRTPKGKDGKPGRFILDLKFASLGDGPPPGELAKMLKLMGKTLTAEEIADMGRPKISIWVTPTGLERIRPFPNLSVTVRNESKDHRQQVYINWDHSTLVMSTQGHRVIRNTPNMPLDLSQPQIFSVVNPGQTVSANINIERN
ncbi:MAG: hypothetical protein AAFO06_21025, partial [Cyanobacteria bacterium J06597_16]